MLYGVKLQTLVCSCSVLGSACCLSSNMTTVHPARGKARSEMILVHSPYIEQNCIIYMVKIELTTRNLIFTMVHVHQAKTLWLRAPPQCWASSCFFFFFFFKYLVSSFLDMGASVTIGLLFVCVGVCWVCFVLAGISSLFSSS